MRLCLIFLLFNLTSLFQHRRGMLTQTKEHTSKIPNLSYPLQAFDFWGHLLLLVEHRTIELFWLHEWMLQCITAALEEAWSPSLAGTALRMVVQSRFSPLPLVTPWNRLMQSHNQAPSGHQKFLWTINWWCPSLLTSTPHRSNCLHPPPKLHSKMNWSIATICLFRSEVIEGSKVPRSSESSFAAEWDYLCTSSHHPVPPTLITVTEPWKAKIKLTRRVKIDASCGVYLPYSSPCTIKWQEEGSQSRPAMFWRPYNGFCGLKGGSVRKTGTDFYSRVCCDRTRANGFKLKEVGRRLRLDIGKKLFAVRVVRQLPRLPRGVVHVSSLEPLWVRSDGALNILLLRSSQHLVWDVPADCKGGCARWPLKVPSNPNY